MKKILTLGVSLIVIFIFLGLMPVHGEADVYERVIRLHVLANSDSEEDQTLKLKVRDEVLRQVADICKNNQDRCQSAEDARALIGEYLDEISQAAEKCIKFEGYSYTVNVLLGEENYPTKNYEDLAFPSGRYVSLRVEIGEADGENWWCVLFPQLGLSASSQSVSEAEDVFVNIGFSGEQYKIITQSDNVTYNVRFKILETIEGVVS